MAKETMEDLTTDECNQLIDNFIAREDDRIEPTTFLKAMKEIRQMTLTTTEEIYEQIIKLLPAAERLRLVGKIVHDLSSQAVEDKTPERHDWMSLRGVAPNLLDGEDAQTWVSRTRHESDEHRERQWRRE
ncbi:MAG: hypothetical protein ACREEM_06010 [Blastocatellia bacterium]